MGPNLPAVLSPEVGAERLLDLARLPTADLDEIADAVDALLDRSVPESTEFLIDIHELRSNIRIVDRGPAPSLLPIFRSQQQAELLALLLGDPDLELSLTELADRQGIPYPSVHREVERAQAAGLVNSRKIGNTRLVRANVDSPYFPGLADVLTKAFGVPAALAQALSGVEGIAEAYVYGSWASRHAGEEGKRPVGDIDVLVLGHPDRDALYSALQHAEQRLGRPVQVTVRFADWLTRGEGSFHDTVTSRPMVPIPLRHGPSAG